MSAPEVIFIVVMILAIACHGMGFRPDGSRYYIGGGIFLWIAIADLGYVIFHALSAHGHGG